MLKRDPNERIQSAHDVQRELRLLQQDYKGAPVDGKRVRSHWAGTDVLKDPEASYLERPQGLLRTLDKPKRTALFIRQLQRFFASRLMSHLVYAGIVLALACCVWLILANHYQLTGKDLLPKIRLGVSGP
jgi:hypothetical protein